MYPDTGGSLQTSLTCNVSYKSVQYPDMVAMVSVTGHRYPDIKRGLFQMVGYSIKNCSLLVSVKLRWLGIVGC